MSQPSVVPALPEIMPAVAPSARLLAAAMAGGLGLVMLFGVALAPIDLVHNAAHDTRHAITVPCH